MTSKRSVIANKKNALRSTGPRTSNGKKRASANALKHGLAANVHHDVAMSARVNELAGVFAGDTTDPHQIENAQIAAEAEIQIQRVRAARVTLIELAAVHPLASVAIEDTGEPPDGACAGPPRLRRRCRSLKNSIAMNAGRYRDANMHSAPWHEQ